MRPQVKKVRVQTTLSPIALERAHKLMEALGVSGINELIDRLVTAEYERRHGRIKLQSGKSSKPTDPYILNEGEKPFQTRKKPSHRKNEK